ncbi:MAG: hypothetical protein QM765_14255 [Myxococcales bacterium]
MPARSAARFETFLRVNVDDAPTQVERALTSPATFRCDLAGMGGFGLRRCPACGAWFYTDWEESRTGSQSNDFQTTYRLRPTEAAMLGLPTALEAEPPRYLEAVLERICRSMQAGIGPFKIVVAVLQAIPKLEPADAHAAAEALRAVAQADPEIRPLIPQVATRLAIGPSGRGSATIDLEHPEIARLLAECQPAR